MAKIIEEKNKKTGVCYAVTDGGLEVPVIDITHPAFEVSLNETELESLLQQYIQEVKGPQKTLPFLRNLLFGYMRKRSVIMRDLMGATGTFMSGMNTYFMKLGPDNLNKSYFSSIDRKITASSAGVYMRLRLQDMAHLLTDALDPLLSARKDAILHLLNIGGGAAIDSLNTLILIRKRNPDLLVGRKIFIYSLDQDTSGPNFGARALVALCAEGAPLHGLEISFQQMAYNWSNFAGLQSLVESSKNWPGIVAVSSEGALFEYGSDEDIAGNLQALGKVTPADAVVAGSVTRADDLGRMLNGASLGSRAAFQFRGLEAFRLLAFHSGWEAKKIIDRPLSHNVLLEKS
jgi:hypothetical protein